MNEDEFKKILGRALEHVPQDGESHRVVVSGSHGTVDRATVDEIELQIPGGTSVEWDGEIIRHQVSENQLSEPEISREYIGDA